MSAYEKAREARIKSNEAELAALELSFKRRRNGAGASSAARPAAKRRRRAQKRTTPSAQTITRKSLRLRSIEAARVAGKRAAPPRQGTMHQGVMVAPWAERLMTSADATESVTSTAKTWSSRHCHQHLMLSRNRRIVATVGCAGYGACFASSERESQARKKKEKMTRKTKKRIKLGSHHSVETRPFSLQDWAIIITSRSITMSTQCSS